MARQATDYHPLHISDQGGEIAAAARRVEAAGSGGGGGDGGGGGGHGGRGVASEPQAAGEKWYLTPRMLMFYVVMIYATYHAGLTGVSWIISLLPEGPYQTMIGNGLWGLFWLSTIPIICYPYVKLCERAAKVKADREAARLAEASNQANQQQPPNPARPPPAAANQAQNHEDEDEARFSCRLKANVLMMWIAGAARIAYLVSGNSFPMVAIAHAVAFVVEVIELLVKYCVEGEISLKLPEV